MRAAETQAVVAALGADGAEIRFVGGCVRDAVLGRPITDIDIATPDPPATVLALLERAGIRAIATGLDHGTVTAVEGNRHFEITTLRVDVETDGRRARVRFTDDWAADAARRDLTINALSCAPDGRLYDPVGGLADLEAGRIRFVGDPETRIAEDVLRLLRFFRFFAWYGKAPVDAAGLAACVKLADRLPGLSGERVRAELFRLLAADRTAEVLVLMDEKGILEHVLPEAAAFDRLARLVEIEAGLRLEARPVRRLAAVLVAVPAAIAEVARRLRLSNQERDYLLEVHRHLPAFQPIADESELRRWFYRHGAALYVELGLLHWAGRDRAPEDLDKMIADADAWQRPRFPLTGHDVHDLGVTAGPRVGGLLEAVETWWLEHDFAPDRAACLDRLRALVGTAGNKGERE